MTALTSRADLRLLLILVALTAAIYANAIGSPFHFDDLHSIEQNPHIRSIGNFADFFTDLHTFSSERRGTMFRPLLLTTYAFNYEFGGADPVGFRWVNVILHALAGVLVYHACRRITRSVVVATLAGIMMVLHPIHSELINYISSRSDLLVSCFVLGAFVLATRESGLSVRRPGAFLSYTAGLLSKSVATTLPVLVAAHDLWRSGWSHFRRVDLRRRGMGYAALAVISIAYLVTITANRFIGQSLAKAPRGIEEQVWTQLKGYAFYIWKFSMPVNLAVEPQFFVSTTLLEPAPLLATALLLSLAVCAGRWWRSPLALGGFWFAVTLLPASLFPLNLLVVERRMYLASVGLILIAGWGLARFLERERRIGTASAAVLGLIFAILCMQRNEDWTSRIGLWESTVAAAPGMPRPRVNLALAYVVEGRESEAVSHLQTALKIQPDFADAWVELGNISHDNGAYGDAERAYRKALNYSPTLEGVYYNLGNVYQDAGRYEEAIAQYRETLRRDPSFANAHNNLGQAHEKTGNADTALVHYRLAIGYDSELMEAWYNLAVLLERDGLRSEAVNAFTRARDLLLEHPDFDKKPLFQKFAGLSQAAIDRLGRED